MFQSLFELGSIGTMTLKNRLIMPPISTNLAGKDGTVSEKLVFHYAERAKGGVGLITVENICIAYPLARHGAAQPRIDDDAFIPGLRRLTDAIHQGGAKAAVELTHPGMNADLRYIEAETPVAPSAVPRFKDGLVPRALLREKVAEVVDEYVEAARRAQEAEFDAVELQACHGLLINQFLSPLTNRREDKYGGDRENRIRFLVEIVEGIKRHVGVDFPVMVRLVAEDMIEGGVTPEEGRWFARRLEEVGADAIHPDFGLGDKEKRLEPMPYPQAWRVYLAEGIKQAVSVPVIAVGVIREPEVAEEILQTGRADFVALGRALNADPEWPNKAQAGKVASIRRCIGCNECVIARHVADAPLRCSLNATVGRSAEERRLEPASVPKRVLVVGGGPAGMEAARVAALRGHQVMLYEQEPRLGGMLNVAALPPGKEKLEWITAYFTHELARLGVEVHLRETMDADKVHALKPEAVIIATGCSPAVPPIPGVDGSNVVVAQQLLDRHMRFTGQRVAIIGGGMLGLETAHYLAAQDNAVTVLKRYETIGRSIEPLYRDYLLRELGEHGVDIMTGLEVKAVRADGVLVRGQTGADQVILADRVVLARGARPANELAQAVQDLHPIVIGDASEPRKIIDAITDGYLTARLI
jgi:2,4-dienoyl-CoA reductase-like NADH-dependent reductase (Old Yellow Enzyme family)/pyruvate/2-oxoglutarate dehydrogenase complex dihydrolipoamide dehydrogenase (E3) component